MNRFKGCGLSIIFVGIISSLIISGCVTTPSTPQTPPDPRMLAAGAFIAVKINSFAAADAPLRHVLSIDIAPQLGRELPRHRFGGAVHRGAVDDAATAPLHGFRDADHYYEVCSSAAYLSGIRSPG